jgi:hypothetical protein
LLLAFLLSGRCAIMVWLLLLLLLELLCELLDLPALLHAVALGVVYRARWTALIAAGGLPRSCVTTWATTPTSCCSSSSHHGSSGQRLVFVIDLLVVVVFAAALNSDICIRLVDLPYLRGMLRMPCMPFCSPGAPVRQAEKQRDVLHIVCG